MIQRCLAMTAPRPLVNILSLLFGLLLGGFSVASFAYDYPATAQWTTQGATNCGTSPGGCFGSPSDAAEHACTNFYGGTVNTLTGGGDTYFYTCTPSGGASSKAAYSCPDGGTLDIVGGVYTCVGAPEPGPCDDTEGQEIEFEFFEGWLPPGYNPATDVSDGSGPDAPATIANAGCEYELVGVVSCQAYVSNINKSFCTYKYQGTGNESSEGPPSNGAPNTACQSGATYGTVNGKGACLPSNTTPTTTPGLPTAPGAPPAPGTVGPSSGGSGGGTTPSDGAGTGSGINGGGVSSGGTGGAGEGGEFNCDGCAQESTQQQVKGVLEDMRDGNGVEEDGTTALDDAKDELGDAMDDAEELIEAQGGAEKQTSLGFGFSPSLPSGSCSPLDMSVHGWNKSYDWCTWISQARDLWGWGIGLLTALYIWRRGSTVWSG